MYIISVLHLQANNFLDTRTKKNSYIWHKMTYGLSLHQRFFWHQEQRNSRRCLGLFFTIFLKTFLETQPNFQKLGTQKRCESQSVKTLILSFRKCIHKFSDRTKNKLGRAINGKIETNIFRAILQILGPIFRQY